MTIYSNPTPKYHGLPVTPEAKLTSPNAIPVTHPLEYRHPFFFSALNAAKVPALPCFLAISTTKNLTKSVRVQ